MRFWDFEQRPYRPVAPRSIAQKLEDGSVIMVELEPDVFIDEQDRIWYAGTASLRAALPTDPSQVDKIPPEFWHPSKARKRSFLERRNAEDARADLAIPKAREWVR